MYIVGKYEETYDFTALLANAKDLNTCFTLLVVVIIIMKLQTQ